MTFYENIVKSFLAPVVLGTACAVFAGPALAETKPHGEPADLSELSRRIQREEDARIVQNMMSRRAFFHGASQQEKEMDMFARRDDASFCQNQGCRIGYENIKAVYQDRYLSARKAQLAILKKIHPEIQENEEWLHVGNFQMHTLSTQIIEIAEDGQTAKAMWYTPGMIAGTNADINHFVSEWIWEKYAVDFIKIDGQWKFWHVMVVTDFVVKMGSELAEGIGNAPEGPEGVTNIPVVPRQLNKTIYAPLSPLTVPKLFPPVPVPYRTFNETFSYGPELVKNTK